MEKDLEMPKYKDPLVSKTDTLREEGFGAEFKITASGLQMLNSDKIYSPEEVKIINHFRFEGPSNPDDMSILYVVETTDGQRGTIVDAFGLYSDDELGEFMKQVEQLAEVKK